TIAELPGEPTARGRIPTILEFVGPIGAVIAVDLGGTQCHGALADLAGGTVAEDFRAAGAGEAAADRLLACIAALKARAAELAWPVRAIVVGIPALIDPATGLATAGPNVDWQGYDLIGALAESLAEPFEVDNDVNLGALGQAWRGAGRGISSFVLMSLGTGIGGALVIDGHLIRGRHNAAGELAYFPVAAMPVEANESPEAGPARGTGLPRSGFEDVASSLALRDRVIELADLGEPTNLDLASFELADVFKAAMDADRVGQRVVRELAGHVAAAIAGTTA